MTKLHFITLFLTTLLVSSSSENTSRNKTWAGSKYEIECTMCAACDNPCNPTVSSPPPPSPPPPSIPPPSNPTINCPPPPSPPSSGNTYSSPPPPPPYNNPSGNYSPPNNPSGSYSPPNNPSGSYSPPPPYSNYPTPPPPNPIVGYFPFYYHSPPPPDSFSTKILPKYSVVVLVMIFKFIFVF